MDFFDALRYSCEHGPTPRPPCSIPSPAAPPVRADMLDEADAETARPVVRRPRRSDQAADAALSSPRPTATRCAPATSSSLSGRSQPTVSHHMKILVDAGLVTREKRGLWVWYRIVPVTPRRAPIRPRLAPNCRTRHATWPPAAPLRHASGSSTPAAAVPHCVGGHGSMFTALAHDATTEVEMVPVAAVACATTTIARCPRRQAPPVPATTRDSGTA